MYSNNILNFQESTTILNSCTKKSGSLLNAPCILQNDIKFFETDVMTYFIGIYSSALSIPFIFVVSL